MSPIDAFVATLRKQQNTESIQNPYRRKVLAKNLTAYFNLMQSYWENGNRKRILLVGEAPGYKGCMLTGVPFSSGRIYQGSL